MNPEDRGAGDRPSQDTVSMIRSEERLDVSVVRTATERVRIRKVIVTEERTFTVQLRREEIVIEREPLDADGSPAPARTGPLTIILQAEEPVVSTRVVPVERVHVIVDAITQMQVVTEEVRAERIALHRTVPDLLDRNGE